MIKKRKKKTKPEYRSGAARANRSARTDMDRVDRAQLYGRGTDKMQWVAGTTYWTRILPVAEEILDHPLVVPPIGTCSYPVHRGLPVPDDDGKLQTDRPVFCLDNNRDNRKCPVCEYATIISASGSPSDVQDAKKLRREAHHMVNLLVRGDQSRIYRVKFGVTVFKALGKMAQSMGDITDPETGLDLQIEVGVWNQFTFPKLAGLTKERSIGDDIPWENQEPITKSLDFVTKFTSKKLIDLLISTYGSIDGHPKFGE